MADAQAPDVSVLVPVYNEIDGLARCHAEVCAALEGSGLAFEVVYVDDGSTDGSTERLRELARADRRVTLVKLTYNVGQQRAMYAALGHCRGRAVITFDADLQFHPECLPRLAAKVLEGHDVVGGIRTERQDSLLGNRIPSWIGRALINDALRIEQQDFGGVKAYSARLVKALLGMNEPVVIIPAMAYSVTRRVLEIPVRHQARTAGHSKWSVLMRMETYLDVYTLYARRPFAWMLASSLASIGLSVVIGLGIVAYRLLVPGHLGGLIIFFDVFLFVTGVFFFALSLIGEFVVRSLRSNRFDPRQIVEEVVRGAA